MIANSREKLICEALDAARAQGIKIWPGAAFDWTDRPAGITFRRFEVPGPSGPLPSACNVLGALELIVGRTKDSGYEGFYEKAAKYLGVGTFWLHRLHIGFDLGVQFFFTVKDKKGKVVRDKSGNPVEKPDEVSKLGMKLRKKYIGKISCTQ